MNARLLIEGRGNIPSYEYILAGSKVSNSYSGEVIIELSSTTSQVNLLSEIESQSGKQIEDIKTDIRVVIPLGVTINPYQHSGATGVDAIDMTGIPSDKSIIIENYGTIIGSSGLGSVGTYSGSNQTRNGQVGHGGSCFKLVNLEKFVLINEGNLYGGKGVGANGSGGRGGNATIAGLYPSASLNGGFASTSYPSPSYGSAGQGGNGGEWDGSGFSSWTRGTLNGSTAAWTQYSITKYGSNTAYEYALILNVSGRSNAGGGAFGQISSGSIDFTGNPPSAYARISMCFPPNGGSQGSAGGKGNIAVGYGRGASGGSGGSAGGNAGGQYSVSSYLEGDAWKVRYYDGVDNAGLSGSAGSSGAKGNGGGILTSATIADFSYVDNGTMLSGKNLDGNAGGYLL